VPRILRFIPEGSREIGRKVNRLGLRRRIGALDRQRREALARVGKTAWQAKVDLTAFADLRDQVERLDARAGDLAATARRLEAERGELQARLQSEEARFNALSRPALARQAEAQAAFRAGHTALADKDRTVREAEARLARVAADLAKLQAGPPVPPGNAASIPGTPDLASGVGRDALQAERETLPGQISAAKAAREPLAADVARLASDSQRCAEEVARIQHDRQAALLPIDVELKRVQEESNRTTLETTSVAREQDDRFASLGAALYDRRVADPALVESTQAVAAVDRERASAQAQLDGSLVLTRAMPRGTMPTFWMVLVVVPILLIALAYGLTSRAGRSLPGNLASASGTAAPDAGLVSADGRESQKDAAVRGFLRSPGDRARRKEAVEILAADLAELGSTADRSHLPHLAKILKGGEPELRAAAAHAIGMIGPTSAEVPLLVDALNDPAPAVREAVVRALGQVRGDPAVLLLVRRVHTSAPARARTGEAAFESEAAPDAGRLRTPIYPGATVLYYASDLENGRAAFSAPDPLQKVLDFYTSASGRQPLGGEEFSRAYFGATPADPTGAKHFAAGLEAWFKQAAEAKRPMAEIEAEANRRTARMANLPLIRYADADLYGTPRFVALEEISSNSEKRAARFVAVFEDRALGRVGFEIHFVPDARQP
jgi:hypothetical protein